MPDSSWNRRRFLRSAGLAGAGFLAGNAVFAPSFASAADKGGEKPVAANEDLMREHGVLRRALLVYQHIAQQLRSGTPPPAAPLHSSAQLFRRFGEDYHERQLEEKFIFPAVRKLKGPAAAYPDVLEKQHDRGRDLTDYVLRASQGGRIANAQPLADALERFVTMYQHHTAREDTIVFVAWKQALSEADYRGMGERFEAIERKTFGHDGFDAAVKEIAGIEEELGLADISQFTIPEPPPLR